MAQALDRAVVERLRASGLDLTAPLRPREPVGPLAGATIVITGTLPSLTREEATELVARAGGKAGSAVRNETRFVVAGDAAGTKLENARALGSDILDDTAFRDVLAGAANDEPSRDAVARGDA